VSDDASKNDDLRRIRATYDAVAAPYADAFGDELEHNPLHRGILDLFATLVKDVALERPVADLGCGPGHIAAYLATKGFVVIGIDLSPAMIAVAKARYPEVDLREGSMTRLELTDASCGAVVAMYSVIHLPKEGRAACYREIARVLCPGGFALVSFHIEGGGHASGEMVHLDTWWERRVDLDGYFLEPAEVTRELTQAGLDVVARFDRERWGEREYPSRRAHLIAKRRA
jgi:SAM-dependent methyltransferase